MNNIIGRQKEIAAFEEYFNSGKPEFIALYGRRRVGKTFLIKELYKDSFAFEMTGIINGKREEQLYSFVEALRRYGFDESRKPKNWNEAFDCLRNLIENQTFKKRCIIFIDELPCLDTPRSGFVNALDHFWNGWASSNNKIMLIVCGSATSWMVTNIIDNHGGLHNRITHEIHLKPFTLHEVEMFLNASNFKWSRLSILQCYMILGGIPYYLSLLKSNFSLAQNIDNLFFAEDGELKREFQRLYASLFNSPENYIQIIRLLADNKKGMTREEIAKRLNIKTGGYLSNILEDLINCDFIRCYNVKKKKIKKNAGIYQLVDFFTLFYLQFGTKNTTDEHYWSNILNTPQQNTWNGLSFERVCMAHISQIKKALGIDKIHTEYYSWRNDNINNHAQIDLIIERADNIINLCEIKFSQGSYKLDKEEYLKFQNRLEEFRQDTKCTAGIVPTFITTYGLDNNGYSENINAVITLDDLFEA